MAFAAHLRRLHGGRRVADLFLMARSRELLRLEVVLARGPVLLLEPEAELREVRELAVRVAAAVEVDAVHGSSRSAGVSPADLPESPRSASGLPISACSRRAFS